MLSNISPAASILGGSEFRSPPVLGDLGGASIKFRHFLKTLAKAIKLQLHLPERNLHPYACRSSHGICAAGMLADYWRGFMREMLWLGYMAKPERAILGGETICRNERLSCSITLKK
jgi:hypothetical protein